MIPMLLKFKGVFSYQAEQVIDFDKLLVDDIFGIFGGVGSGKSSILEAMTLVLYHRVSRMKTGHLARNVMNLKSNEFFVDFIFRTDDEHRYRFQMSGKRNKKNFDDVSNLKYLQYEWHGNEWVAKSLKAEDILGISYDNFNRMVIIPQGKFSEFLQLQNAKRTEMLEEIFHLQKYNLADRVTKLQRLNQTEIDLLEGEQNGLIEIHKNLLEEKQKQQKETEKNLQKKTQDFKYKQQQYNNLKKIKDIFQNLKTNRKDFQKLQKQKPQMDVLEDKIDDYESCERVFKADLNVRKDKINKINQYREMIEKENHLIDKNQKEIRKIEAKVQENQEELKLLPEKEKKARDLGLLIKLKKYLQDSNTEKKKYNTLKKTMEKKQAELERAKQECKQLVQEQESLQETIDRESYWKDVQGVFEAQDLLEKSQNEMKDFGTSVKNEIQKLKLPLHTKVHEVLDFLQKRKEEIQSEIEQEEQQKQHFLVQVKLLDFAKDLSEGQPCPLCGATHHPNPFEGDKNKQRLNEIEKSIRRKKSTIKTLEKSINTFTGHLSTYQSKTAHIDELKKQFDKKKRRLIDSKLPAWEEMDVFFSECEKAKQNLNVCKREIKEKESLSEKLGQVIEREQKEVHRIQNDLSKMEGQQKQMESGMDARMISRLSDKDSILEQEQQNLVKSIDSVILEEKHLQNERTKLVEERAKFKAQLQAFEGELLSNEMEKDTIEQTLQNNLEQSKFNTLQDVEKVLAEKFDVRSERKQLENYRKNYGILEQKIKDLEVQCGEQQFDENEFTKLEQELGKLEKDINLENRKMGELKSSIREIKVKLKRKKELEQELKVKTARQDRIKKLASVFYAKGFVNFVSFMYLQNLVRDASERFYFLSRRQFKLELDGSNEMEVIDLLNDGKRRSVQTLSGGQTFQVSLSLALALAGSVGSLNSQAGSFFFLDEGFGTQDEESLRLVFDTIRSLKQEHRKVGLISHVEELKEEVSTYLSIKNNAETGSEIKSSW